MNKQRKKWMSGIQMNVEDVEKNGMYFHYHFCADIFYQIPGFSLLFL